MKRNDRILRIAESKVFYSMGGDYFAWLTPTEILQLSLWGDYKFYEDDVTDAKYLQKLGHSYPRMIFFEKKAEV